MSTHWPKHARKISFSHINSVLEFGWQNKVFVILATTGFLFQSLLLISCHFSSFLFSVLSHMPSPPLSSSTPKRPQRTDHSNDGSLPYLSVLLSVLLNWKICSEATINNDMHSAPALEEILPSGSSQIYLSKNPLCSFKQSVFEHTLSVMNNLCIPQLNCTSANIIVWRCSVTMGTLLEVKESSVDVRLHSHKTYSLLLGKIRLGRGFAHNLEKYWKHFRVSHQIAWCWVLRISFCGLVASRGPGMPTAEITWYKWCSLALWA